MSKLAVKRLSASDLTFFEWHFRERNAGNQKSINLNKDVFIDRLFPALPSLREEYRGRFPVDLTIFGPGTHGQLNVQRKITKKRVYKNWRLNGECVFNPESTPERFNCLEPGDFVILDFEGEVLPLSLRAFFVTSSLPEDARLHAELVRLTNGKSMVATTLSELSETIINASASDHPVQELVLDEYIVDAAYNGINGTRRLNRRRSGNTMSQADLQRARSRAEAIGRLGEELVQQWLAAQVEDGLLYGHTWVSDINAIAPYDFEIVVGGNRTELDVKSTSGRFERPIHVSFNELLAMRDSEDTYDLYRVYDLTEESGKLRIASDMKEFATGVVETFEQLPDGVIPDSVSIDPGTLDFGAEIEITFIHPDDEQE